MKLLHIQFRPPAWLHLDADLRIITGFFEALGHLPPGGIQYLEKLPQVLLGILLLVSIAVILVNLLTDVAYALFDPRVRY